MLHLLFFTTKPLNPHTNTLPQPNQPPIIMRSSAIAAIALAVGAMASPIVKKQSSTVDDTTILNYACESGSSASVPGSSTEPLSTLLPLSDLGAPRGCFLQGGS